VTNAWKQSWKIHRFDPGLLHHSDRVCQQYPSKEFRSLRAQELRCAAKATATKTRRWKAFGATLKTECFGSYFPETREKAEIMIFDYIESFYNRWHLHSALGYKSPLEYESPQSHKPDYRKSPSTLF
jgi:putative transposase